MKQYIKEGRIITATDKMYQLVYKEQGFIPLEESQDAADAADEVDEVDEAEDSLERLSIEELKGLCNERGIEYKSKIKKDELIQLLEGME